MARVLAPSAISRASISPISCRVADIAPPFASKPAIRNSPAHRRQQARQRRFRRADFRLFRLHEKISTAWPSRFTRVAAIAFADLTSFRGAPVADNNKCYRRESHNTTLVADEQQQFCLFECDMPAVPVGEARQ